MAPFVALTGFMGSGKSSVGAKVATLLGWRFVDLDDAFVESVGTSIAEFFASKGEKAFRLREYEILASVLERRSGTEGLVVALGGGTLETPAAADLVARLGGLVLLEVEEAEAWARVQGTGRPLGRDREAFGALLAQRQGTYESLADWVVPVAGKTVDLLAREIVEMVSLGGERWQTLWGRRLSSTERGSLIIGGTDALRSLGTRSSGARQAGLRMFVITDKNVMNSWGARVCHLLGAHPPEDLLAVEPGEGSKSVAALGRCWDWLAGRGARRDDVVVALGGGVLGDLAGFCAATYQRGVSLWQIPTTLLAQVDSSVGGKTAINLGAGKNLVGAFYQPDLVLIDPATLGTLGAADYAGGLGEVVKYALLMSPGFLDRLEGEVEGLAARDPEVLGWVVKACVAYKASVVEEDEREQGRRAVLNLGHTVAHALETTFGYGAMSHGQAVALGLLVALAVSERLLGLDAAVRERTRALLSKLGLATAAELPATESVLAAASRDKKVRAGTSGFVGLQAIGGPVWPVDVSGDELSAALEVIRE